jgi:hypothetical protein
VPVGSLRRRQRHLTTLHDEEPLKEADRVSEAVGLYLHAAETGDPSGLLCAADLLERTGRFSDAADLRRYGLTPGGNIARDLR